MEEKRKCKDEAETTIRTRTWEEGKKKGRKEEWMTKEEKQ